MSTESSELLRTKQTDNFFNNCGGMQVVIIVPVAVVLLLVAVTVCSTACLCEYNGDVSRKA